MPRVFAQSRPRPKLREQRTQASDKPAPEQALATLAAYRRDAMLEAVAMSAKELLRAEDLGQSLSRVVAWVGQATGVDRVHLFEIDPAAPPDQGKIRAHYRWSASGTPTPAEFDHAEGRSMAGAGLKSWVPRLARGEAIVGHIQDFEATVRRFFERGGLKSTAAVPIFADGRWWGFIGFDSCRRECEWSPSELDTLKTLAELVGAAVCRARSMQSLADASHIIANSPTILFRIAPQEPFPLTYLSQNIARYGYDPSDILASPTGWQSLLHAKDRSEAIAQLRRIVDGTLEELRFDFRLRKSDGGTAWFDGEACALRDGADRLIGIEGLVYDVTERKRAEDKLAFSHILLTTAIESSPDAILIVDEHDKIIAYNRHFVELWDIPPDLMHARSDEPVLATVASRMRNQDEFLARVRYLYARPEIDSHEELELADGRIVERHSGCLYDPRRNLGRVWFFRDITEKKRALEKVERLARTDPLTGLANRASFLERLTLEFARVKRGHDNFAVLYLDLDHFKDVNDTLGHPVGDTLLQAAARRIKNCVRETDLVARLGGDEFAVLQSGIACAESAEILAAKLCRELSAPFMLDGNQVHATASIGIVPYAKEIENPDDMMSKADLALYRAKDEGRDQYRLHVAELDRQVWERVATERDLRHALERDEFELYYQPQVELASGRIVGLEALIRWNHPTRGLLLPDAFVPIAETTGSIVAIGHWVIERACAQLRRWLDREIGVPILAVNLSGAQFKLTSNLDRIVSSALTRFDITPEHLELELTETVLMETAQKHGAALTGLRQLGVRLSIDDFGTGYSSLDYLRSFHASRLKIDRRFVGEVASSAGDAAIVRAIIGLARELGIEVVAEGVETEAQRVFLLSAGCALAQGNYFCEAVPVSRATELLRRGGQTRCLDASLRQRSQASSG